MLCRKHLPEESDGVYGTDIDAEVLLVSSELEDDLVESVIRFGFDHFNTGQVPQGDISDLVSILVGGWIKIEWLLNDLELSVL